MTEKTKQEQNVPQVDKVDDESLDQVTNGGRNTGQYEHYDDPKETPNK